MMKNNSRLSISRPLARRSLYLAVAAASQLMMGAQVWAGPEGGQVVGGSGVIDQSGVDTIIHQATDRLAIDWQSFNVGADERVEFIQPNSSSIALNRVLTHSGSEIHGRIDANGHVFLVNPNGVFFGENSQVNVGGIIASGLNIEPSHFMNGDYALQSIDGTEGRVINHGIINAATGGSVALIGQQASNEGFISANLGAVSLAAGNEAVLTFDSRGLVGVKVTEAVLQNDLGVDAAVINSGEIRAQGGRVLLTASVSEDIFSQAVNHGGMNKGSSVVVHEDGSFTLGAGADVVNTGEINVSVNSGDAGQVVLLGENITSSGGVFADTLQGGAGHIELHSVDTTLVTQNAEISAQAANQGSGGDIKVLGSKVGLLDNAEVNTSGANGGGQILIGGDETGNNRLVRNAEFTYLSETSAVKADALYEGNGGRLITFASDTARIHGKLSVKGGYAGGDGGFIETSGLKGFELTSTPDITAQAGKGGVWLIDPYDITIDNDVGGIIDPSDDPDPIFLSSLTTSRVNIVTLRDVLNTAGGGEVIIQTGSGEGGEGNITLVESLTYDIDGNSAATLRLNAHNNIIFNESQHITGSAGTAALNIILTAGGSIEFNSGSYINTFGGDFYASGLDFTLPNADAITVNTGINPLESSADAGGDITLNMTGAVSLGSVVKTDGGNFTVENSSSFTNNFDNAVIDTSNDFGGGDINIHSIGDINLGEIDFSYLFSNAHTDTNNNDVVTAVLLRVGSVTALSDEGNITLSHALNFNDTGKRIGAGDNGYGGSLLDDEDTYLSLTATAGDITINGLISDVKWGDARDSLDITLIAGGDVNVNADIYTAGGNFTASGATFSSVFIDGDDQTSYLINTDRANSFENDSGEDNGNATWSNGGNVEISASDSITLGDIVTDLSCTATSPAACTGNLIVAGRDTDNVDVTQAEGSTLVVHGVSTFNVGTGSITLTNDNLFNDTLSFISAGTTSVKNNHEGSTELGLSNISGDFQLVSNGAVTQTGPLIEDDVTIHQGNLFIAGTTTISANNNEVILTNEENDFEGLVNIAAASSIELFSKNDLDVGDLDVSGSGDRTAGSITLTAENGYLTTGSLTTNGSEEEGNQALRSGGEVTLRALGDIAVGAISTVGRNGVEDGGSREGGIGGNVEITSVIGNIELSSIITNGGDGEDGGFNNNRQGGNAGNIDINVAPSQAITLTGNITSQGGINGGSQTHGQGGNVTFTGNVELSGNGDTVVIDTSFPEEPSGESTRGNTSFSGTVNSASTTPMQDLTLIANQITFGGNMGESNRLGLLTIDSTANLDAITRDFYLGSLNSQTHNFSANLINTVGAADANGGLISVLTGDTRTVVINEIDTQGGFSSGAAGMAGGDITNIIGNNITLGLVNTSGSDGADLGGNAGSITVTAPGTNPVINLDGDIITQGGAGTTTGNNAIAQFNLASAGTVNLNYPEFYNSSFNVTGSDGLDTITGPDASITWTTTDFNQGTITLTPPEGQPQEKGVVTFASFGALAGNSGVDTFNLGHGVSSYVNGAGGNDIFNLIGGEGVTFNAPINGGDGNDEFNINANTTGTLTGDDGDNIFNILSSGLAVNLIVGSSSGNDQLNSSDSANQWTITNTNSGRLEGSGQNIVFQGIGILYGGTDVDNFTIDAAGVSITLSGGGAPDGFADSLTAHSDTDNSNTWTLTGARSGTLANASETVSFSDIQSLNGGSGVDTFEFSDAFLDGAFDGTLDGGDGDDDFTLTWNVLGEVSGGEGNDTFSIQNQITSIIAGGEGDDEFRFGDLGSVTTSLNGGGGENTIVGRNRPNEWLINGVNSGSITDTTTLPGVVYVADFQNIQNLTGGSAVDTFQLDGGYVSTINGMGNSDFLIGDDFANQWSLDSNSSGDLLSGPDGSTYEIEFSSIENLTGNDDVDTFIFNFNDTYSGTIDAVGENNIVQIATDANISVNLGESINGVINADIVLGNGEGTITVNGESGDDHTWTISDLDSLIISQADGVNDGTVTDGTNIIRFIDFANLTGSDADDTFTLSSGASITGNISGADGANSLNNNNSNSTWTLIGSHEGELRNDSSDLIRSFQEIQTVTGSGTDTLIGRNQENDWQITTADAGSVQRQGNASDLFSFSGMENITGGTEADSFTFGGLGSISGNLDGGTGSGTDTLYARNSTNNWSITGVNEGNVTDEDSDPLPQTYASFLNIENLVGGDGEDRFSFVDDGSIIDADGGEGINSVSFEGATGDILVTLGTSAINGVRRINQVIGNNNSTTLNVANGNNTWTIFDFSSTDERVDGINDGEVDIDGSSVVSFINFSKLLGGSGTDTFDLSDVNAAITDEIDGGGGANNTLIGKATDNTWTITDARRGSLSETTGPATYVESFVGIDNLEGNTGADNFTFNLDPDNFATSVAIQDVIDSVSLNGGLGDGVNTLDLSGVTTNAEQTALTYTLGTSASNSVINISQIRGNSSDYLTLAVASGTNTWTIDGENDGTITSDSAFAGIVNFFDFNNLQGGSGDDTFIFDAENNGSIGSIDGGVGGDNTLIGKSLGSTWSITSANNGSLSETLTSGSYVESFTRIQNLEGNIGADSFIFNLAEDTFNTSADIQAVIDSVSIDGGAGVGVNTLDLSGVTTNSQTTALTYTLGTSEDNSVINISQVKGNNSNFLTLAVTSGTNTWTIDGANDGNIISDTAFTGTINFIDFRNLQGGSGDDIFIFDVENTGSIGSIDGGGGENNELTAKNLENIWTLAATNTLASGGSNYVDDFSGIQTLRGGSVVDTFNINADFGGIIYGGDGADDFFINAWVNEIHGEAGSDTFNFSLSSNGSASLLNGGDLPGTDLLIGRNANNTWSLGTTNTLSLTDGADYVSSFTNMDTLQGGSSVDNFTIDSAFSGDIYGGGDADYFTINAAVGRLYGEGANDTFDFSQTTNGVAVLVDGGDGGDGGDGESNTLIGRNTTNDWLISGEESGTVTDLLKDPAEEYVTYSNIQMIEGRSGNDTLSAPDQYNLWVIDDANSGTVNGFSFSNIQNLRGGELEDVFEFLGAQYFGDIDAGAGINTVDVSEASSQDITVSFTGEIGTVYGVENASIVIGDNASQRLVGSTTNDVARIDWTIEDWDATGTVANGVNDGSVSDGIGTISFVDFANLVGSSLQDVFTFNDSGSITQSIDGVGPSGNEIVGRNTDNDWFITNNNNGYIEQSGAHYLQSFTNIQALSGGNTRDDFFITAGLNFGGTINGGDGANSLSKSDGNNTWALALEAHSGSLNTTAIFENIQQINGGAGTDTLIAAAQGNDWYITNNNAGSLGALGATSAMLTNFSGIENLTGNTAIDRFTFDVAGSISGLIDGGTSSGLTAVIDVLNLTDRTGGVSVELGNSNTDGRLHVVNVEQIDASSSNPNNNFLFGASDDDNTYTWEITGENAGTVAPTLNTSNEAKVSFNNFGNLRGGTNDDRFEISNGEITGNINGGDGDGVDYVDYSNSLEDVAISIGGEGGLGVTGISGIEGVIGNNSGTGLSSHNSTISVTGNTNNIWNIEKINAVADGINDGELVITLSDNSTTTISFENFNVINGGEGDDRFNLTGSGQLIGTINGGLGDNVFNASGSTAIQNIYVLANAPTDIPVNSVATNLFGFSEIAVNSLVNNSLFSLETDNAWVIGANDAGTLNSDIDFSGFTNLIGGAGQDVFTFSTLTGSSVRSVDGGIAAGSDSVIDRVDLVSVSTNVAIGVGASAIADLNVLNIEQLDARPESSNTLVADNISANIWDIDAENAGSLNNRLAFSGFANLRGRDTADTFNFIGVDAYISGVIDGGVGSDTIDLVDAGRALDVHLVNADLVVMPNAINVIAIEQLNGSEAYINTLLGSDIANAWVIDGANNGSLNNANNTGLKFANFENLVGGSNDDTFAFDLGGELDGYVDGGNHLARDTVDMSLLATVDLQLGSDNTGYRNIERYIGNNAEDSIIRGNDANNIWTLEAGLNRGNIGGAITFEGFANLYGGGGNDTFIFNQGELTGSVNGGAGNDIFNVNSGLVRGDINGNIGNDTLNVTVNETESRLVSFIGGEGINDVTVNGGNQGYRTVHGAAVEAGGELRYTDASGNTYTIAYSDANRVNDNVESSLLTLNGTLQQDEFTLLNNRYLLNGFTDVRYTTKNNLTIAASADDSVYVDAVINIPQRLRVQNASLSGSSTSRINATDLHLDSTGNVGGVDDRLRVNVNNLLVTAARGDIYLEEQNSLNIAEFGSSNRFDIDLLGTLTSNVSLSSPGDFAISAGEDIVLDSANALSGRLDLSAGGEISLTNTTNTNLGTIQAQALNVNSTAAINGLGQVTVAGLATFASGSNIELNNATNSFNSVAVTSAQDVSLVDTGLFILENINMSGLLQTSSATLTQNGSVNVGSAALTATDGLATLGNNITANEAINVFAQGIAVNGGLTGGSITLDGDTGNINLGAKLDANGAGGVTITGNLITQSSDIESGGNIAIDALGGWNMASGTRLLADAGSVTVTSAGNITTGTINAQNNILLESIGSVQLNGNLTSTAGQASLIASNTLTLTGNVSGFNGVDMQSGGNLQQQAEINSGQGDITATVTGDITMASNAVTTATQGSINYGAANIGISTLNAQAGTVTLNATQGAITNNMGNNNNVVAQRLVMDAISGIGAIGPIKTQVSELSASNFQGNINLENNLELTVDRLRTNGDIALVNTVGDVILDNTNGLRFSREETDARLAGGTANSNYEIGTFSVSVSAGSLLARGPQDLENPDVIAYNANLFAQGEIGSAARPLVIYVKNNSVIFGRRSWGPLWGFGVEPANPVNNSIIQSNLSDLLAAGNEQLVEVETLEEVDPAIFTSVRNYFFDDISILMPADQRYDDEDDEYAD